MHSASCPFKVNLSLWPSISSSICLSSKNTCDTAVLESFEGTQNCHETKYVHKCFGRYSCFDKLTNVKHNIEKK